MKTRDNQKCLHFKNLYRTETAEYTANIEPVNNRSL